MPQMAKLLNMTKMLAYTLPAACVCWAIGAGSMYHFQGPGLLVQAIAFATALAVAVSSVTIVRAILVRSEARAAGQNLAFVVSHTFTISEMANMLAVVGLGLLVWCLLDLPRQSYFAWLLVFYGVMLAGKTCWLMRTMRRFTLKANDPGALAK